MEIRYRRLTHPTVGMAPRSPGPRPAALDDPPHPRRRGEASTAQAYGGLTPRQTKEPSFSQPCQALSSQLDVCQQGRTDLQEQQRKCPMPRPPGKSLAVALASDGHIHRQLPSETETPENAGRGEQGHFVGAFGFRPQEEGGGNKGRLSRWLDAHGGEVRFLVSAAWHFLRSFAGVPNPDIDSLRPRVYFLHEWTLCGFLTLVLLVQRLMLPASTQIVTGLGDSRRAKEGPPCSSQPSRCLCRCI